MRAYLNRSLKACRILATGDALLLKSLAKGVAASTEHFQVLASLGTIDNIIDIGANRGQFSLAARYIFPFAKIIAFEPLPLPFSIYKQIFARDSKNLAYNNAIGIERTNATIHISSRDDSSSLLPITDIQEQLFPGTAESGTTSVSVERLDALITPENITDNSLMKIDVQGYEYQVLEGSETLLGSILYIYIECSFVELYKSQSLAHEIIDWLHKRGFILSSVHNISYDRDNRAVQADFLFRNIALRKTGIK